MRPALLTYLRARFGAALACRVAGDLARGAGVRPGTDEYAAAMQAARAELAAWDAAHAPTVRARLDGGLFLLRADGSRRGRPRRLVPARVVADAHRDLPYAA